ncbi:nucleotide exchange factor GrpE [Haloparvum sp. PAK95]|uniref:nucleotide exchange factor GrpE n=1 Tax=Haloparvum sp. PAK95 TaxID=3418962 RepID=UPI003D2EAE9E
MSEDDAVEIDVEAADDADAEEPDESAEATESVSATDEEGAEPSGDPETAEADGETADDTEPTLDDGLAARVANHDEAVAADVAELEARVAELENELAEAEDEIDDLTERLKRKQADFQNYKQRQKKKRQQIKERAAADFVEQIVDVRDNLIRALEQEEGTDIRPGVESTLEEFDRVLAEEDVEPIEPEAGEEVDPTRHQVMLRVESDQPEGTIAELYQPGYEMGDSIVREAQVTVSDGE